MMRDLVQLPHQPRYDYTALARFQELTLEEWREWWKTAASWENGSRWFYGDLFNAGARFVPEKEKRKATEAGSSQIELDLDTPILKLINAGVDARTLLTYAHVARAFPPERREPACTWSHHRELWAANVSDAAEQSRWLARAVANGWSVADLRQALAPEARQLQASPSPPWFVARKWANDCLRFINEKFPPGKPAPPDQLNALRADLAPALEALRRIGVL